jgi:hypothetical protein
MSRSRFGVSEHPEQWAGNPLLANKEDAANNSTGTQADMERSVSPNFTRKEYDMGILWTIIIGFVAGVIAKFIMPGDNEPTGFILTAIRLETHSEVRINEVPKLD